jgi:hypothetical protein
MSKYYENQETVGGYIQIEEEKTEDLITILYCYYI